MATVSPGTMAVVLEVRLPVTAVGLVSSIVFRLLQKQKLFRVGITSTLLVSLMNVGYLTKYSTLLFGFAVFPLNSTFWPLLTAGF